MGNTFNGARSKTFSNDKIKLVGVIVITVKCSDWTAENVKSTVVEDGHHTLFVRKITVERDKYVKFVLDSKIKSKSFYKSKFQMPKNNNFIDSIQQKLNAQVSNQTAYFAQNWIKVRLVPTNFTPRNVSSLQF